MTPPHHQRARQCEQCRAQQREQQRARQLAVILHKSTYYILVETKSESWFYVPTGSFVSISISISKTYFNCHNAPPTPTRPCRYMPFCPPRRLDRRRRSERVGARTRRAVHKLQRVAQQRRSGQQHPATTTPQIDFKLT